MNKNISFFKTTSLYKEFIILDLVERNSKITQREISKLVGTSVSTINSYIDEYELKGYIKRLYISNKNIEYYITKKGVERKRLLNIEYLKDSYNIYSSAKQNILSFLEKILANGYKKILLYGAGKVAELLLLVIKDNMVPLIILGVIDDDKNRQGKYIVNFPIYSSKVLNEIEHDAILISSYKNKNDIYKKLLLMGYKNDNILMFFEE